MAEYINREDVIDALYAKRQDITNIWCRTVITECVEEIQELPSADVQPVKHGRWIDGDYRCVTAVCSNCNHLRLGNGAKSAMRLALYCERCGARMDGET